ncbi:helix-turn-helix domain-containing protein [Thioalkalivibrio sp. ALgr3]|uniref:helix-turn-helix domain-containing protein n=1 Tax=Thioalkalivibrio sp. ALgr3 TaxID=1239292 RepID=UPI00036C6C70|nr:helix-turn-helix domain-containing protein [Thioalkalivibrio sp. ALgr3]
MDIIRDAFQRIEKELGVDPSRLQQIEQCLRDEWGRDTCYIATMEGQRIAERNRALVRDYMRGERVPLLARRYGISARQVYRILRGG